MPDDRLGAKFGSRDSRKSITTDASGVVRVSIHACTPLVDGVLRVENRLSFQVLVLRLWVQASSTKYEILRGNKLTAVFSDPATKRLYL